jgi:hypothetical protein
MNRRSFGKIGIFASAMSLLGFKSIEEINKTKKMKNVFIHHVFFWLKNTDSKEDLKKLIEGLNGLSKVKTIQDFHMGKPAGTSREVIDGSYAISWYTTFKNGDDQQSYQVDPIHLEFVKNYSHLWSKVIVYDSIDL